MKMRFLGDSGCGRNREEKYGRRRRECSGRRCVKWRRQSRIIEPVMVRIPEGWFEMGCASGRDDEKPVHRVWVDAFELGAYQVTNEEYACFLAATSAAQPPRWNDANFNDPKMPVAAVSWHEAAAYCEWLSSSDGQTLSLAERSRMGTRGAGRSGEFAVSVGRCERRRWFRIMRSGGSWGRSRSVCMRRTLTDSTIWATTFTNGARTGTTRATTRTRRSEIRRGRRAGSGARREAARGDIILR